MVKLLILKALKAGNVDAALRSATGLPNEYVNWAAVRELCVVYGPSKARTSNYGPIEKMVGHNIITVDEAIALLS